MPSIYGACKYASAIWAGTLDTFENIVVNVRDGIARPPQEQPLRPEHNLSGKARPPVGGARSAALRPLRCELWLASLWPRCSAPCCSAPCCSAPRCHTLPHALLPHALLPHALQVCLVTGGNAGIGYATARMMAERGAHLFIACRSPERGAKAAQVRARSSAPAPGTLLASAAARRAPSSPAVARGAHLTCAPAPGPAAAQELRAVAPLPGCAAPRVEVLPLDLASLDSVRSCCRGFSSRGLALDVLVCNAGLMSPPQRLQTQDGLEMQFQVWALLLQVALVTALVMACSGFGWGFGRSRAR
jgi:hypothetical protein